MAAVPPVFALTPALVDAGVIDYSTNEGRRLYLAATKSLSDDTEGLYDGTADKLSSFLHKLKIRAIEFGWMDEGVLDINIAPELVNLLEKYGDVTIEQVRTHVQLYSGVQNRAAQDCVQVFNCVMKSLTNEAINKIKHKQDEYTLNGTPSGVLLVKIIVKEAHLDTNATLTRIRNEIANLDEYMIKINHNVAKFNLHVQELVSQLNSRGEGSDELLNNLFKAYKVCNDEPFVRYIESKENNYDDGVNITPQNLMDVAGNKYQVRVDNGQWQAPSQSQTQIIALKAEMKKLKTTKAQPKERTKVKRSTTRTPKSSTSPNKKGKPDWMMKKPTSNESRNGNKKEVDGKTYYWCNNHKAWGRHKQEDCKGLNYRRGTDSGHSSQTRMQPNTTNLVQSKVQATNTNNSEEDSEYQSE